MIGVAKAELEKAKKSYNELKTECNMLDYGVRESLNCGLTTCLDMIKKMNGELLKGSQEDECECNLIKQQISLLYQEKIKIQQCAIQLNSHVEMIEAHVGFEKE